MLNKVCVIKHLTCNASSFFVKYLMKLHLGPTTTTSGLLIFCFWLVKHFQHRQLDYQLQVHYDVQLECQLHFMQNTNGCVYFANDYEGSAVLLVHYFTGISTCITFVTFTYYYLCRQSEVAFI